MLRLALVLLIACASPPAPVVAPRPAPPAPTGDVTATRLTRIRGYLPRGLAVDATHVYWTIGDDLSGSAWRLRKDDDDAEQLADVPAASACVLVGDELWISAGGGVVAVPKTGGAHRHVAGGGGGELVRGPDGVYVANPVGGVTRISPAGVASIVTVRPATAIAGGDAIVFATSPDNVLWRLDGGVPVELARLPAIGWQLAIHRDTVFVAMPDGSNTTIATIPLTGGPLRTLATHPHGVDRMVVDDLHVWWAAGDGVMKLVRATGAISLHAADPAERGSRPDRRALVADAAALYWLSTDHRGWKSTSLSKLMSAPTALSSCGPRCLHMPRAVGLLSGPCAPCWSRSSSCSARVMEEATRRRMVAAPVTAAPAMAVRSPTAPRARPPRAPAAAPPPRSRPARG